MRRVVLLVCCVAAGLAVGIVGARLSGSDGWYLAIPAAIAAAWLFVANPENCRRRRD